MKRRRKARSREQMFEGLEVGGAMSYSCGSDSYGYWITEVDKKKNLLGVYTPKRKMTICWQDGRMTAEAFCPTAKTEKYFTAFRGKWYGFNPKTKDRYKIFERLYKSDVPHFYCDPSF